MRQRDLGMLTDLAATWRFVVRRALAHWRLLSAVVIGVVLASAIMSGTVIYFDSLRELALDETLGAAHRDELDIALKTVRGPTTTGERDLVASVVVRTVDSRVGWFVTDRITAGASATLFRTRPGEEDLAGTDGRRAYFAYAPRLTEFAGLIEGGRPPVDGALTGPDGTVVIEALAGEAEAIAAGVAVGDTVAVVPYWDDRVPYAHVVVTGLIRPLDPASRFWSLERRVLGAATGESFSTVPLFVSETGYFEGVGRTFADLDTTYAWLLAVDPGAIGADTAVSARLGVEQLRDRLDATLFAYRQFTSLDRLVALHDQRVFFSRLPMYVVMIMVAVVVLYYVVTLSALLMERQRGEIALLRSRGAGTWHLVSIFALEGLMVAGLGVVAGPLLAAGAIELAGLSPAFSGLGSGRGLEVEISGAAYGLSALGGAFSFMALMVPAVAAARVSVTGHRRESARPQGAPLYQRLYIDVLLLIVSIVLFRQLTQQGSVVATRVFGELAVNQLVLALPAITLLAVSMLLLRLFPLAMRLASRALSAWMPAGPALGIWQMARNPVYYARISLLLMLTAGLGIFAASFGGTLERSFSERVLYETGADLRAENVALAASGSTRPVAASYEALAGVDAASPAYRGRAFDLTNLVSEQVGMLAVSSESFGRVAWHRGDFAARPLPELVESLRPEARPEGIQLPAEARTLVVDARIDRPQPSMRLTARVADANGRHFTYDLGALASASWRTYEVPLSRLSHFRSRAGRLEPTWPLRLISIAVSETDTQRGTFAGSILIDRLSVRAEDGSLTVIDDFSDMSGWGILRTTADAASDSFSPSGLGAEGGDGRSMRFTWSEGPALEARGVYLGPDLPSLPVAASESFMEESGHSLGDVFALSLSGHRVKVHVAETFRYFPTLDTETETFVVADLDSLSAYANADPSAAELRPNEVWIASGATGDERAELRGVLRYDPFSAGLVHDRELSLAASRVDPLTRAGWRALLFIAFGAVFVLSCVGFVVHAHVSYVGRRVQFALLRTVGLSRIQLATVVALEQMLVIGAGMALGAWMGERFGAIVMPFLASDELGGRVLPPFVIQVDWALLAITYGAMVGVFLVITALLVAFAQRISVVRTLRLGEN